MVQCHRRPDGASGFWQCQCTCLGGARPPRLIEISLHRASETKEVPMCGHDGCTRLFGGRAKALATLTLGSVAQRRGPQRFLGAPTVEWGRAVGAGNSHGFRPSQGTCSAPPWPEAGRCGGRRDSSTPKSQPWPGEPHNQIPRSAGSPEGRSVAKSCGTTHRGAELALCLGRKLHIQLGSWDLAQNAGTWLVFRILKCLELPVSCIRKCSVPTKYMLCIPVGPRQRWANEPIW